MTSAATAAEGEIRESAQGLPHGPLLPLVSVVVVNFNYGRFLEEAIESVFCQTWTRFECIVVDNGSTDESGDVIDACLGRHPEIVVHRRAGNGGQTTACLEGLGLARGAYVVFLDADDYLLPHCLTTHMAVHLASRLHVGFTTGDMLQMADGQVVLSTNEATTTFLAARVKPRFRLCGKAPLVPTFRPTEVLGPLAEVAARVADRVYAVPRRQTDWAWAPTSGNCFRRDVLTLLCDGGDLGELKSQTDLFLALGVNALSGSLIIDEPLFCYRLHGSNVFSSRAQLDGFLNYDTRRTAGQAAIARRLIVDQLAAHPDRFVQEAWMQWSYFSLLKRVDSRVTAGPWTGASYAARAVATNFEAIADATGWWPSFLFVLKGAPLRIKLAMLLGRRPGPA